MPSANRVATIDVPPEETSGRVSPVNGKTRNVPPADQEHLNTDQGRQLPAPARSEIHLPAFNAAATHRQTMTPPKQALPPRRASPTGCATPTRMKSVCTSGTRAGHSRAALAERYLRPLNRILLEQTGNLVRPDRARDRASRRRGHALWAPRRTTQRRRASGWRRLDRAMTSTSGRSRPKRTRQAQRVPPYRDHSGTPARRPRREQRRPGAASTAPVADRTSRVAMARRPGGGDRKGKRRRTLPAKVAQPQMVETGQARSEATIELHSPFHRRRSSSRSARARSPKSVNGYFLI